MNRKFTVPQSSKEASTDWFNSDPVSHWIEDCVDIDFQTQPVRTSAAYAEFKGWATFEGYNEKYLPGLTAFTKKMKTLQGVEYKRLPNGRFFVGISLRFQAKAVKKVVG